MGATHKGELSASIAILGLLSDGPDTAAGIALRLTRCFPRARFSRSVVHNTLPSLERRGLVRPMNRGAETSLARYELTARGRETLERWLHSPPTAPPVLRDYVQGKIAFADHGDIHSVIETVREDERLCAQAYAAARARLVASPRPEGGSHEDWKRALARVMIGDEATMWLLRVKRLQRLQQALEQIAAELRHAKLGGVGERDGRSSAQRARHSPYREAS